MPYLPCSTCNHPMEINIGLVSGYNVWNNMTNPRKITGSAICRNCGAGTGFEITDNTINYVSGKSGYGSLAPQVSSTAKTFYAEAEVCFQSGTPNAAATMCRAAIEIALTEAGYSGSDLYSKIENAKKPNGVLDDIEVGLAHASRLITRDAIHRADLIQLADIPSMLSATIQIMNKLAS